MQRNTRNLSLKEENKKRSLIGDDQGSIFIEFIFFFPIIVLIWTLLSFVYASKLTAVDVQGRARQCTWDLALGGCRGGVPASCQGGGSSQMNQGPFDSRASGAHATLRSGFSAGSAHYANPHGRSSLVRAERSVNRPAIMGGSTMAESQLETMCGEDPPRRWTTQEVFAALCRQHGRWCP